MDMYVAATLLCMNMYVWTLMLWTCMNIDVRVPSLIAGSLPAIMIWHNFLRLLLLTVAAFIFGLYYGRRISIAWISNESDPTRLWSGCRQHASMWNVTPVNIGWTIGTPSRVNEILGQICWADNDEWQVQRERERERGHPLNAKCLKMFHLTYFLYCKVLAL